MVLGHRLKTRFHQIRGSIWDKNLQMQENEIASLLKILELQLVSKIVFQVFTRCYHQLYYIT